MSKKLLIIIIIAVIGFAGLIILEKDSQPKEPLIGIEHADQGQTHVQRSQKHPAYNSDPASSGWHYADQAAPAEWGIYTAEVPDEVSLHNEEHGGVVITYNPDLLSVAQVKELQSLFATPYSDSKFQPTRFVLTPRSKDAKPIEMAAWRWTLSLNSYDQATIEKFYLQHSNHSPETGAGPTNAPINEAARQ